MLKLSNIKKQYKMGDNVVDALRGVDLEFRPEALEAVADLAIQRNIGARGLRAVMEGLLTGIMYDVPSDRTISKVVITKGCVEGTEEPDVTRDPERTAGDYAVS